MKKIGFLLIILGFTLLVIMTFNFIKEKNRMISPIPEEKGVKVIFISPTTTK